MKKTIAVSIVLGLLVVGCSSEDKESPTQQTQQTQQTQEAKVSKQTIPQTDDQISKKTAELKQAATELLDAVQEQSEPLIEKTEEYVEAVKNKSVPIIVAGIDATTEMTEHATATIQEMGGSTEGAATPPETILMESKKGTVSFSHTNHSDSLECSSCHGETEPGPVALDKKAAHALCKGCHKENESGPTKCSGCHEKKPKAAIEGC